MVDEYDSGSRFGDSAAEDIAQYRPVSGWAVAALLMGIMSAAAMAHPLLWFVPVVGIGIALVALHRIRVSAPRPLGRGAAIAGLALAILFGVAAPSRALCYRWIGRQEATRTAERWFDYLRHGEPEKAYQLQVDPVVRFAIDKALWDRYREDYKKTKDAPLKRFVENPIVRMLLALDDKAQVRLYEFGPMTSSGEGDSIIETFAVTFDDAGKKKSLLLRMRLEATPPWRARHGRWRVAGVAIYTPQQAAYSGQST